ncbi:GDP-mannose 4,6-dehydratase [Candidatus Peregrinibacteria bacterium]|nr:GDP-mannose 4,6-dehydratase [Candidatus Peregrinibacteria bacterium]
MSKRALITGINGQDGSYLAELLVSKGYTVYGFSLKGGSCPIQHLKEKICFIEGDIRDQASLEKAIVLSNPDEIYHLAAISFVGVSWQDPLLVTDVNALGTVRLLESVRRRKPTAKIYHASTSEMFGQASQISTEESPFHPKNPYAVSKCFSHWISVNYRESYGLFVCCGILFNHESPRRDDCFVTQKIAKSVVQIKNRDLDCFYLGNIHTERDWGYAGDYVKAMWLMLQQDQPDDYIISTGETHTVREFLEEAFGVVDIHLQSNGKTGLAEEFFIRGTDKVVVKISKDLFRPVELTSLKGLNDKASKKLGWKPQTTFKQLVRMMVEAQRNQRNKK